MYPLMEKRGKKNFSFKLQPSASIPTSDFELLTSFKLFCFSFRSLFFLLLFLFFSLRGILVSSWWPSLSLNRKFSPSSQNSIDIDQSPHPPQASPPPSFILPRFISGKKEIIRSGIEDKSVSQDIEFYLPDNFRQLYSSASSSHLSPLLGIVFIAHTCKHHPSEWWPQDSAICPECLGMPIEKVV